MKCAAWIITIPEPPSNAFASRLKAQEDYLGSQLAPWLLDGPPASLASCHSFHFMRYIDATHEGHGGITIELRVLGTADAVQQATSDVQAKLEAQQNDGAIVKFEPKKTSDWQTAEDYGGTDLNEAFARLLASSARLALELLRQPRRDFASRTAVVENWAHCVRLVAGGLG